MITTCWLVKTNEVSIFKPIRDIVCIRNVILERGESKCLDNWFRLVTKIEMSCNSPIRYAGNSPIRYAVRTAVYTSGVQLTLTSSYILNSMHDFLGVLCIIFQHIPTYQECFTNLEFNKSNVPNTPWDDIRLNLFDCFPNEGTQYGCYTLVGIHMACPLSSVMTQTMVGSGFVLTHIVDWLRHLQYYTPHFFL